MNRPGLRSAAESTMKSEWRRWGQVKREREGWILTRDRQTDRGMDGWTELANQGGCRHRLTKSQRAGLIHTAAVLSNVAPLLQIPQAARLPGCEGLRPESALF